MQTQVLIAGAGPTGLTLALWLRRLGVAVRIIDKAAAPGETSRALAVQARTLEYERQIGVVDDVLAAGVRIEELKLRTPRGLAAILKLGAFGAGLSRYPFAFALPQDVHERILLEHLERAGVQVERRAELVGFTEEADGIIATLRRDGADEAVRTDYLCGCDGAHSVVRHALGIDFPGGAYAQSFYVADVEGTGDVPSQGMNVRLNPYGFALLLPVRQTGTIRLIGIVPRAHEGDAKIDFESIRNDVERDTGVSISAVKWFSAYRVHHRVAQRFRVGRAFLAGDAGHIHSPAGGQGMNTGIGDAVNLAWKLAAVLQGRADPRLLDSYEVERLAFARLLINSTDQAFKLIAGRSHLSSFWRQHIMPRVAGVITRRPAGARAFFRLVSQTRIDYRHSAISAGKAGEIRGGDRLPYVEEGSRDNFESLATLDWQVHVYGRAKPKLSTALAQRGMDLCIFDWTPAMRRAGFERDAAYLVRPDGHVALADSAQDAARIARYLDDLSIRARQARPRAASEDEPLPAGASAPSSLSAAA